MIYIHTFHDYEKSLIPSLCAERLDKKPTIQIRHGAVPPDGPGKEKKWKK